MVERHHDNAEAVLFFALPWYSYWAALQYWNEFKVSIGFVSLSRTPERNENLKIKLIGSTDRFAVNQRWSEFFVTMFPAHQGQHEGRPVETAEGGCHE
jgi:hypothetical protein